MNTILDIYNLKCTSFKDYNLTPQVVISLPRDFANQILNEFMSKLMVDSAFADDMPNFYFETYSDDKNVYIEADDGLEDYENFFHVNGYTSEEQGDFVMQVLCNMLGVDIKDKDQLTIYEGPLEYDNMDEGDIVVGMSLPLYLSTVTTGLIAQEILRL